MAEISPQEQSVEAIKRQIRDSLSQFKRLHEEAPLSDENLQMTKSQFFQRLGVLRNYSESLRRLQKADKNQRIPDDIRISSIIVSQRENNVRPGTEVNRLRSILDTLLKPRTAFSAVGRRSNLTSQDGRNILLEKGAKLNAVFTKMGQDISFLQETDNTEEVRRFVRERETDPVTPEAEGEEAKIQQQIRDNILLVDDEKSSRQFNEILTDILSSETVNIDRLRSLSRQVERELSEQKAPEAREAKIQPDPEVKLEPSNEDILAIKNVEFSELDRDQLRTLLGDKLTMLENLGGPRSDLEKIFNAAEGMTTDLLKSLHVQLNNALDAILSGGDIQEALVSNVTIDFEEEIPIDETQAEQDRLAEIESDRLERESAERKFERDFPRRTIARRGSLDPILSRAERAIEEEKGPVVAPADVEGKARELAVPEDKATKVKTIIQSLSNSGVKISGFEMVLLFQLSDDDLDLFATNLKQVGVEIPGFLTSVAREQDSLEFEEEVKKAQREKQKSLALTTEDIKDQIADLVMDTRIRDELPNDRIKLQFILNELFREQFLGVRPDIEFSKEDPGQGFKLKGRKSKNPRRISGLRSQPQMATNLMIPRFQPPSTNLPPSQFKSGFIRGASSSLFL